MATWLSEPGIYRLLMGSEQPKAKQFAYFITDKLLPGIRAKLTEADTCIIKEQATQIDDQRTEIWELRERLNEALAGK